jgi:3-phosphoshikimate 1-carboxyvinyltransferase
MGAIIEGRDDANFAPLTIRGAKLKPNQVKLAVSSAQVKSAILLAGLYADGVTSVEEPVLSRDHTENFLEYFGAKIRREDLKVSLEGGQTLKAKSFDIAGDISSAAFFMAAALLATGSRIEFKNILFNETRIGIVKVLQRMGARLESLRANQVNGPEPVADFTLSFQGLRATEIHKEELPSLIDEIPILCVIATQAQGRTVIREADELRVKETDRIDSMVTALSQMGAKIKAEGNTIIIDGPTPLRGAAVDSRKDHRTAMSMIVAGMIAEGEQTVRDIDCINTSFPTFFQLLDKLGVSYLKK